MKVIAICNLPDGIKLDYAWFTAEDGLYAQKVAVRPLPEKSGLVHQDVDGWCKLSEYSRGWNACIDEIMGK